MATLSQQSLAVIAGFRNQPGVTEDQARNLHSAVVGSPELVDQFNAAVANGAVKSIVPLTNPNAGAEYDPGGHSIRMPLGKLTTNVNGTFAQGEITFAMGHELQHGLNRGDIAAARASFKQAIIAEARSPGPVHDYTVIVEQRLAASRQDEASSHLAGWNALAGMVRQGNPNASLQDVYEAQRGRARDFVDANYKAQPPTFTLRPGLSVNADQSMSATPANIEAVAKNWFDNVPQQLGTKGSANYPNYYGSGIVGAIVQMEHHFNPPTPGVSMPVVGLDMPRLRLSERQLEEAGLDFGSNTTPMTYLDMSRHPRTSHLFQHTAGSHRHVSPIAAEPFEPPMLAPSQGPDKDDPLRHQIREGVRALDRQVGRDWDAASERTELSLLVLARQNGLRSVDHVVLGGRGGSAEPGENVFLIEGGLTDPAHRRVQMKTLEAATTPVEVSQARLQDLGPTSPAIRRDEPQLQQAWQQEAPALRH